MQFCFSLARLSKNYVNKTSIFLSKRANSSLVETFTRSGFVDQVSSYLLAVNLEVSRSLLFIPTALLQWGLSWQSLRANMAVDSRDNFQGGNHEETTLPWIFSANTCSILNWLLLPCRRHCSTQFPPSLAQTWFCLLQPSLQSIQALQNSEKGILLRTWRLNELRGAPRSWLSENKISWNWDQKTALSLEKGLGLNFWDQSLVGNLARRGWSCLQHWPA